MKIIFSRKGFDSGTGGKPSPILSDGYMISLPIPDRSSQIEYRDINLNDVNLGKMVGDLTHKRITGSWKAHLDPDLNDDQYPREADWRPLLGQVGAAQTHLAGSQVSAGDIFLFFGWFRAVEMVGGNFRYVRGAPDLHVLFGWLQIEQIVSVRENLSNLPAWMAYHPHVYNPDRGSQNTLYIASDRLNITGLDGSYPGAGCFPCFSPSLQLTADGKSRSIWQLPEFFYPTAGRTPLSYHSDPARWELSSDRVNLKSAARGQEFILNADEYPESANWLCNLFSNSLR